MTHGRCSWWPRAVIVPSYGSSRRGWRGFPFLLSRCSKSLVIFPLLVFKDIHCTLPPRSFILLGWTTPDPFKPCHKMASFPSIESNFGANELPPILPKEQLTTRHVHHCPAVLACMDDRGVTVQHFLGSMDSSSKFIVTFHSSFSSRNARNFPREKPSAVCSTVAPLPFWD